MLVKARLQPLSKMGRCAEFIVRPKHWQSLGSARSQQLGPPVLVGENSENTRCAKTLRGSQYRGSVASKGRDPRLATLLLGTRSA